MKQPYGTHITQDLPESLQYHINNLRLHVERANDHLPQASTHVENIGAHPEHYADSLARADGHHTMQPFYPKGQPKGRGKSRSMDSPSTATTAAQTDPVPPYHSMVSHPAPRTPAPSSTNPCPTIPEGPVPAVQTSVPSAAPSELTPPPRHALTSGPPNKQPSQPIHRPPPNHGTLAGHFRLGPSHIHHPHPCTFTDIPTGSTPEQHFSPFLSLIGSSHSMQRHSRLSYALADLVATDYNLGYSFGIK